MIIRRPLEIEKINRIKKWTLVYGRIKTGKTFLIQNFIKHDEYFFVKANKSILVKDTRSISYETFLEILKRELNNNKTVVVDEFHRLDNDFFDFLHALRKSGKLILISSTLSLSKKLLSSKSALLGLFAEVPISLISLRDVLSSTKKFKTDKKEWLELALLLQEPIASDYFDKDKKARDIISQAIGSSIMTVPALVGEIFSEEAREISAVYEGIMRGIAIGKINSGELSSYLFSKKTIKKDDPSIIQQYLNNLLSFDIIKKIKIYNKKRFAYKLASSLSRIYYYSDEKYNISERKVTEKDLIQIIDILIPRIIEDSIRTTFAEKYGLQESISETADYEIDGILLKFNKPEVAIEVKWKIPKKEDILKAEKNLNTFPVKRRILFVPDKSGIQSSLEIMDAEDLL